MRDAFKSVPWPLYFLNIVFGTVLGLGNVYVLVIPFQNFSAALIGSMTALFVNLILLPMIIISGSVFGIANRYALAFTETN